MGCQGSDLEGRLRVRISRVRVHRDHLSSVGRWLDEICGNPPDNPYTVMRLLIGQTVCLVDWTGPVSAVIMMEAYRCQSGS